MPSFLLFSGRIQTGEALALNKLVFAEKPSVAKKKGGFIIQFFMKKRISSIKRLEFIKQNIVVLTGEQSMRILTGATSQNSQNHTNCTQNTSLDAADCSGLRTNTNTQGSSVGVG
ncbi:hypothetical protein [Taibaiella chishuiensis]|uniref:hypothetical protein n=1 Tax=Taibaiella chishuiensis TaxID=1434707 RepID=UPI0011B1FA1E|nr:hypothetical protein [Taibaiella chishuiensis]